MDIKHFISEKINDIITRTAPEFADSIDDGIYLSGVNTKNDYFTVGYGKSQMTPKDINLTNYYLAGYNENRIASGISDPLYAHALWIDDNSGNGGNLFISLDTIGLLSEDVQALKKLLNTFIIRTNCKSVSIMCTGTHSGIDTIGLWGKLPHTGKNKKFMSMLSDAVIKASLEAFNNRKQGNLYYGFVHTENIQQDLRLPVNYSDMLTRLHFESSDKTEKIYIINYSAVPCCLMEDNLLVSADYPGFMAEKIKEDTGAETFFFTGAAGGAIIPLREDNEEDKSDIFFAKELGYKLAEYVISISNEKILKPAISYIRQEFYCPVDNPVLASAANLGIFNTKEYTLPYETLKVIKSEISFLKIDKIKILMIPGLIFPELVFGGYLEETDSAEGLPVEFNPAPLAVTAGDENLIIASSTNDNIGYIIPPNDFMINPEAPYLKNAVDRFYRKHYEERYSLGAETAVKIAETFSKILEIIKNY